MDLSLIHISIPARDVRWAIAVPMTEIWRTIRGYILWSYERGTIQYDVCLLYTSRCV